METGMCAKCLAEDVELFTAPCNGRPVGWAVSPMGMYHCRKCGVMLIRGIPHPKLCKKCIDELGEK